MALSVPKLDDRSFQDLVDEAKKRIPHYCQEWTDHNVSDPGVTLIELFAWMTEVLLYRLNQVPDLHYIKFLEMFGIRLQEPQPAHCHVTFWLTAPQPLAVVIPANTEVATTQTETEASIVFSTDVDLRVQPPKLVQVLSRITGGREGKSAIQAHNLRRLEAGFEGLDVFSAVPQVNDALYFGFENDLSNHLLGFETNFDPAGGAGIAPGMPPYIWEASTGKAEPHWVPCEVDLDTTKGMNSQGRIRIHVPQMGQYVVNKQELYWVRARVREISETENRLGMKPYSKSPRLRQVTVASWGGTVPATHSHLVERESLGQSDGSPGQRFYLQQIPVLKRRPEEHLRIQMENEPDQHWTEVSDFGDSDAASTHYILDSLTGELRLGPAVREPEGTVKLYGAVPPRGARLVFERYRHGGGTEGDLQSGALDTLKTAIPFIGRVSNRGAASGGLDAETLEAAMLRAPAMLRTRDRAVTEADYEFLARQASAAIGRVKCLQPLAEEGGRIIPGQIYVLAIPHQQHPERFLEPSQLELKPEVLEELRRYLDERRMLTTRLDIRPPAYRWVTVKLQLKADPSVERAVVEQSVLARLNSFLNPLVGGPDGRGWPFGRELFIADVYQCLQGLPDVQFVRSVEMFEAKPGGDAIGDPLESLNVAPHGVIVSARHKVEFL
jgi:predicted phage baseplate assembly protein